MGANKHDDQVNNSVIIENEYNIGKIFSSAAVCLSPHHPRGLVRGEHCAVVISRRA